MIRRMLAMGLCSILATGIVLAEVELIENPKNPPDRAGAPRVAVLTEVMRISDDSGDFLFSSPWRIKIAPDGSVFVSERDKLFKFSPDGKFQKNLLVMGEGPGEVKRFADFVFDGSELVIGGYTPVKLIFTDFDGRLKNEIHIEGLKQFTLFCHVAKGRYFFRDLNLSFETVGKLNTGIIPQTHTFFTCDRKGKVEKLDLEFKTKSAMVKKSFEGRMAIGISELTRFLAAFDGERYLYVFHTDRYRIVQVDLTSGRIVKRITRAYSPVPFTPKPPVDREFDAQIEKIKDQIFYNDVQALQVTDNRLMVFTSTMDARKRILVDVFNDKGQYVDCFFLKIPDIERPDDLEEKPVRFHQGHFWTVELNEEDVPSVVKYKLSLSE